jgi:hypothetical protein
MNEKIEKIRQACQDWQTEQKIRMDRDFMGLAWPGLIDELAILMMHFGCYAEMIEKDRESQEIAIVIEDRYYLISVAGRVSVCEVEPKDEWLETGYLWI